MKWILCFALFYARSSWADFPLVLTLPPLAPVTTGFTAAWNPDPGADGFVVIVKYGTNVVKKVDVGTNLEATVFVPGGYDYTIAVEGYAVRHQAPGFKQQRLYGAPCAPITNIPPLPENSPQLLVLPPNWFVMCQCSNGGYLLTTTNWVNWSTNSSIPTNFPMLAQGEVAGRLFFRSVTH